MTFYFVFHHNYDDSSAEVYESALPKEFVLRTVDFWPDHSLVAMAEAIEFAPRSGLSGDLPIAVWLNEKIGETKNRVVHGERLVESMKRTAGVDPKDDERLAYLRRENEKQRGEIAACEALLAEVRACVITS